MISCLPSSLRDPFGAKIIAPALRFARADQPSPWVPGALVPVPHPHGTGTLEVTADNVPLENVIFSAAFLAEMNGKCGAQQARHACPTGGTHKRSDSRARPSCAQSLNALKMEHPPHGMLVDHRQRPVP